MLYKGLGGLLVKIGEGIDDNTLLDSLEGNISNRGVSVVDKIS